MAINAKAVLRVIIEGEWIWVQRGTFTVVPLEFVDDDGTVMNASGASTPAYYFVSTQGDPYFGPLSSISLFKLDNQSLSESETSAPVRGRPQELPEGSGETFGGIVGGRRDGTDGNGAAATADDDRPPPAPQEARKRVPLFADDVDDDEEPDFEPGQRRRGGGLF